VSAHWETAAPQVTGTAKPTTLHDFAGFPSPLYARHYSIPGDPALAGRVQELLDAHGLPARCDAVRGLDHGAWVPLALMFPTADIPVVQLSVQPGRGPLHHLLLGLALSFLRTEGILILASGSATHNLREVVGQSADTPPPAYVREFDAWLKTAVVDGRTEALLDYEAEGPYAGRNHPTAEHFLPLLVALGAAGAGAKGRSLHSSYTFGTLSMAAFAWN
jgi:4,5-DOPA dioxygenase extradiol